MEKKMRKTKRIENIGKNNNVHIPRRSFSCKWMDSLKLCVRVGGVR